MMNQRQCKERAIFLLNESDKYPTLEGKKIVIAGAQVWATLANIPDEEPVDRGELGPL